MSVEVLRPVFVEALGLPRGIDVFGLKYHEVAEWNAASHLKLVAAIEAAFRVALDAEDVLRLRSFRAATEILSRHGVPFA